MASTGTLAGPFGFVGGAGYRQDGDSGLMLLGARYYDPSVGRFISRDPIRFSGGDANLYRYCGNGPAHQADPSGLAPWWRVAWEVVKVVASWVSPIPTPLEWHPPQPPPKPPAIIVPPPPPPSGGTQPPLPGRPGPGLGGGSGAGPGAVACIGMGFGIGAYGAAAAHHWKDRNEHAYQLDPYSPEPPPYREGI